MTTWKKLIEDAFYGTSDSWENVIAITLTEYQLNEEFDAGYGGAEGKPFTLWTTTRVYFPIVYDGAEWVGSASRNPDGIPTGHQGGE